MLDAFVTGVRGLDAVPSSERGGKGDSEWPDIGVTVSLASERTAGIDKDAVSRSDVVPSAGVSHGGGACASRVVSVDTIASDGLSIAAINPIGAEKPA